MIKKITTLLLLICILFSCSSNHNKKASKTYLALDTIINVEAYGKNADNALKQANDYIYNFEDEFSRTKSYSSLALLNNHSSLENPSPEMLKLIEFSEYYNKFTDNAFDITIASIADLWGFTKDVFNIPSSSEISECLANVGMEHIKINDDKIVLDKGTKIDFGGIAKGSIAQNIKTIFKEQNIESGFANLSGDVLVYGYKVNGDNWAIGIQDPFKAEDLNSYLGILNINNAYVFTSGNYQRYFDVDGERYHHIIDPRTGYPANNDLMSVTIVANSNDDNGIMADALSTALFVLGEEDAINLWRQHKDLFDIIVVNNKHEIIISERLNQSFILSNQDYKLKIVK